MRKKSFHTVSIGKRKFAYQAGVTFIAVQEVCPMNPYLPVSKAIGLWDPLPSFVCELQNGIDIAFGVKAEILRRLKGD